MTVTTSSEATRVDAPPPPARASRPLINTDTMAAGALFVAIFAFLAALFAIGLAARAVDEHRAVAASIRAGGAAPVALVEVSLTEFAIAPGEITVPAGGRLAVANDGHVEHNLAVEGSATPMLASGASADLDLAGLAPGRYVVICEVPGHEAAGMRATLVIS